MAKYLPCPKIILCPSRYTSWCPSGIAKHLQGLSNENVPSLGIEGFSLFPASKPCKDWFKCLIQLPNFFLETLKMGSSHLESRLGPRSVVLTWLITQTAQASFKSTDPQVIHSRESNTLVRVSLYSAPFFFFFFFEILKCFYMAHPWGPMMYLPFS